MFHQLHTTSNQNTEYKGFYITIQPKFTSYYSILNDSPDPHSKYFSVFTLFSWFTSLKTKVLSWNFMNSNSPCSQQPTPLNQNRYLILIGCILYISTSGNIYFGWPGLSSLLFDSGAYSWLCENDTPVPDRRYLCEDQDTAVQRLYQIAMPSHFMMAMLAGFLIDNIGPRYTAVLGQLFNLVAWALLLHAKESFNVYVIAFILIGFGADTSFLPTLHVSNLFPGYNGIIIALLGAANSASFAVPAVMWAIHENHHVSFITISIFYIILLSILALYAYFCMPDTCYKSIDQLSDFYRTREIDFTSNVQKKGSIKYFLANFKDSLPQFKSKQFVAICFYFCTTSLAFNFYVVSGEQLLSTSINNFYGLLTPFSFAFTLVYGKLVDHFGPIWVLLINTLVGIISYITANTYLVGFKYTSAVCMTIYVSIYTSQFYFYIKDRFDDRHFGKLVGTVSMFGGALSLLSVYLYDPLTKIYFNGNFLFVSLMMLGLLVFNLCSLVFMVPKLKTRRSLIKTESTLPTIS